MKGSTRLVGQLYPVLKSKDGQIIDGFHRLEADPNWKTVVLDGIDSEEKVLLARLVANKCRRTVTLDEARKWINQLAEMYLQQGVKPGEISSKIAERSGYSERQVRFYLDEKYKAKQQMEAGRVSAAVAAAESSALVKRAEEMLGVETFQKVRAEIEREVREKIERESAAATRRSGMRASSKSKPDEAEEGWECTICGMEQDPADAPVTVKMCMKCNLEFAIWVADREFKRMELKRL